VALKRREKKEKKIGQQEANRLLQDGLHGQGQVEDSHLDGNHGFSPRRRHTFVEKKNEKQVNDGVPGRTHVHFRECQVLISSGRNTLGGNALSKVKGQA